MRQIQHFFLDADLSADTVRVSDRELINQLLNVLRFKTGDACVLLDNRGLRAQAVVELLHRKEAVFKIQARDHFVKPARHLCLAVAIPKKPATLEWILEKATELGVSEIVLLDTARTQVHELRKLERAQAIIKEASEQSERIFIPELQPVQPWADFVSHWPEGLVLAGDVWDFDVHLGHFLQTQPLPSAVTVIIGPEGGLTTEELATIRAHQGSVFQLGTSVLRMETAVIASLSLLEFSARSA